MDRIINLRLLAHPLNWGIVWAVLLLAGYALASITHRTSGGSASCGCGDAAHPD